MSGLKIVIPFLLILNFPSLTLAQGNDEPAGALVLPEVESPEFLDCLGAASDGGLVIVSQVIACAEDSGLALGLVDADSTMLNQATKWDGTAGPNDPRSPVPSQARSNVRWDGSGGPDDPRSPIPAQARANVRWDGSAGPDDPRSPVPAQARNNVRWDGSGGPDDPRSPVPNLQYILPPDHSAEGTMPPILMSENGQLDMDSTVIVMERVDQAAVQTKSSIKVGTVLAATLATVGFFAQVAFQRFGIVLQALM